MGRWARLDSELSQEPGRDPSRISYLSKPIKENAPWRLNRDDSVPKRGTLITSIEEDGVGLSQPI